MRWPALAGGAAVRGMKDGSKVLALVALVTGGWSIIQFDACARGSGTSVAPDVAASEGWRAAERVSKRDVPSERPSPPSAMEPLNRNAVSAAEFGESWPFTVPDGLLYCLGPSDRRMVVFVVGEKRYAINGNARESKATFDFFDLAEIERRISNGTRVPVGEVIAKGLSLCPAT